MLKKGVALPPNATLNNNPIYKVDLAGYAYGISAPSSMLVDMVLAGIPTAVWRDRDGAMDADNDRGLTEISGPSDWLDFSHEATLHPERFREGQAAFIERLQMPLDPADIYRRFAALFAAALRMSGSDDLQTEPAEQLGVQTELAQQLGNQTAQPEQPGIQPAPTELPGMQAELAERHGPQGPRVMFIANSFLATLQLSFFKPLQPMIDAGTLTTGLISEQQLNTIRER